MQQGSRRPRPEDPFLDQRSSDDQLGFEHASSSGSTPSIPDRQAVQASLRAALEACFERWGALWLCTVHTLRYGMLFVTLWADRTNGVQRRDKCDQPFGLLLHLWLVIFVVSLFQQAIVRHILCYYMSRDGPLVPCRVVVFRRAWLIATVLWPVIACWTLWRTQKCDGDLKTAVRVVLVYYAVIALVAVIVPAFLISLMLFLIRRGFLPMPRSRHAAPDDFIDRLPELTYDPALFSSGTGMGVFPVECPICLEAFDADRPITQTPCQPNGHVFHTKCLQGWLQCARTCPMCRTDLPDAADEAADLEAGSSQSTGTESASDDDSRE